MFPVISLFGINIDSSILMWCIGILFSFIFYIIYGKKLGISYLLSFALSILILLIEMIGAKILYIIENYSEFLENGFTFAGFSLLGVYFSIPLFTLIIVKIFKIHYLKTLDFIIIGVFIELGFYRIGCMLEGCCAGFITDWGIPGSDGYRYFPTQIIESVLDIALAVFLFILLRKRKLQEGSLYLFGVLIYSLIRFILEFTRIRTNIFLEFSSSHIICFILIIVCLILLIYNEKKSILRFHKSIRY